MVSQQQIFILSGTNYCHPHLVAAGENSHYAGRKPLVKIKVTDISTLSLMSRYLNVLSLVNGDKIQQSKVEKNFKKRSST
jgi:hypothetical protein